MNGRELIYIVDYGNIPATLGMGGYWFVDTTKGDGLQTITPKRALLDEPSREFPELKQIKKPPTHKGKPSPRLNIQFIGDETNFKDDADAKKQIKILAGYLIANPNVLVHLTGNTGTSGSTLKEGNGDEILNRPAIVNGQRLTERDLQIGRAKRVEKALIEDFNIAPNRITTGTGSYKNDNKNKFVGVQLK